MPVGVVVLVACASDLVWPGRTAYEHVGELVKVGVGMIRIAPFLVVGMGFEDFNGLGFELG